MAPHYLSLEGVPFSEAPDASVAFFWRDPQGTWLPNQGYCFFDVERVCVQLHDAIAGKIFGTMDFPQFHRHSIASLRRSFSS